LANKLPVKMLPDGTWETFADPERFGTQAYRVPMSEFQEIVKAFCTPTK